MAPHLKKSVQLLKDLQRSRWLPAYNDKSIKDVIAEITSDNEEMRNLVAGLPDLENLPTEVIAGLCLYNDLIDRNRRCLLAYLFHRLGLIEGLRWEVGLMIPEEKLQKLHESEKQYLHLYNACLDKYMKHYLPNAKEPLDLVADAQAPEELNVQIRVLDEGVGLGEVVTADSGTLKFVKGWVHTAKRTDVEQLIRAGKVEHVKSLRAAEVAVSK